MKCIDLNKDCYRQKIYEDSKKEMMTSEIWSLFHMNKLFHTQTKCFRIIDSEYDSLINTLQKGMEK